MVSRGLLLVLAVGASAAIVPRAQAFVTYTADNPAANFTLFVYDSPSFITTDTVVPVTTVRSKCKQIQLVGGCGAIGSGVL